MKEREELRKSLGFNYNEFRSLPYILTPDIVRQLCANGLIRVSDMIPPGWAKCHFGSVPGFLEGLKEDKRFISLVEKEFSSVFLKFQKNWGIFDMASKDLSSCDSLFEGIEFEKGFHKGVLSLVTAAHQYFGDDLRAVFLLCNALFTYLPETKALLRSIGLISTSREVKNIMYEWNYFSCSCDASKTATHTNGYGNVVVTQCDCESSKAYVSAMYAKVFEVVTNFLVRHMCELKTIDRKMWVCQTSAIESYCFRLRMDLLDGVHQMIALIGKGIAESGGVAVQSVLNVPAVPEQNLMLSSVPVTTTMTTPMTTLWNSKTPVINNLSL